MDSNEIFKRQLKNQAGRKPCHKNITIMEENKEKQVRKQRVKNGERTSKMCSFRLDADVVTILAKVANKSLLINRLVREWWASRNVDESHTDVDPATHDIEDTQI